MVKKIFILYIFIFTSGLVLANEEFTPAELYHDYCSVCHGDGGEGAVWTANGLDPMPADFTDPKVWLELKNRNLMIEAVTYGIPQTAMAGWGKRLPSSDIEEIVDYVRDSFMQLELIPDYSDSSNGAMASMENSDEEMHDHNAHGTSELMKPLPNELKGDLFRGESLYNATCAECHGEKGNGKGPRAYFVFPKPRNFLDPAPRASYSKAHLYEATAKGIIGTEMPAWDKVFGEQELADVSEYIFDAFIAPNNPLLKMEKAMEMPVASDGHTDHQH